MRLQLKSIAATMALLVYPAMVQAQGTRPTTPARPGAAAHPTTPVAPDEATTGQLSPTGESGTPPRQATAPGQAGTAPGQAGATPGQEQASPGGASELTPAVTGQTPSGQATGQSQTAALRPVTRSDLKAGTSIYDQNGSVVGKVESVSASGAVISTGTARATIPVSSFAKGDKGLVIGMSKADIDAAARKKGSK